MDEAVSRGGRFTNVLGKLESEPLVAENLTLFSAAFEKHDDQIFCRVGDEVFEDGGIEPIPHGTKTHQNVSEDSVDRNTRMLASAGCLSEMTPPPTEEIV